MIYNIVLVSCVQQSDLVIYIHLFFFRFLSHKGYCRVSSIVPCVIQCVFVDHIKNFTLSNFQICNTVLLITVTMLYITSPWSLLPYCLPPLATTNLFSHIYELDLSCFFVCLFLDSTYKWDHMVFFFQIYFP